MYSDSPVQEKVIPATISRIERAVRELKDVVEGVGQTFHSVMDNVPTSGTPALKGDKLVSPSVSDRLTEIEQTIQSSVHKLNDIISRSQV